MIADAAKLYELCPTACPRCVALVDRGDPRAEALQRRADAWRPVIEAALAELVHAAGDPVLDAFAAGPTSLPPSGSTLVIADAATDRLVSLPRPPDIPQ